MGVFIDDGEHTKGVAFMGAVHDKIIRPDMIPVCGAQAYTRTLIEP